MSNLILLAENRIFPQTLDPQPLLLNGTGGAPARSQDAHFPMDALLNPGRYTAWKCASPSPGTINVDFDLGALVSTRHAALARHRVHTGSGITSVQISTGGGSTYPPTWTSRGTLTVTTSDVNLVLDFGSAVSIRYVRFAVTDSGRYSCKLWCVKNSLFTDFGNEGQQVETETSRRRLPDLRLLYGGLITLETAGNAGAIRRRFRLPFDAMSAAVRTALQSVVRGTFLYRHHDGAWHECVLASPQFEVGNVVPSVTALYRSDVVLEALY